jgi:ssDNA-binding Zn-finger/Zn-ribbon topoisomerase 1
MATGEPTNRNEDRCPQCGDPIDGIAATGGGHRFVGCGHPASARFLPSSEGPTFVGVTVE